MSTNNIWDLAIEHSRKNEKLNKGTRDSLMLVIGSKNAGKTTICYKFVEKNDIPKPTLALDYSFARRSRSMDLEKDVCHIWELGGSTIFKELLQIPITEKSLLTLSVILVLDLSAPEELWFTMQTLLSAVKKHVAIVLESTKDPSLKSLLAEQIKKRINKENVDENVIDPFPVPLLIVGSKYDLFQEIESEKRKLICKCLRYLAYINGASLQFVSARTENLMNKIRVSLSHMVFGTPPSKTHTLDYNKPLHVPFGIDSFQAIGPLPDPDNASININIQSLDAVTECFIAFFPQIEDVSIIPDDPGSDPHFREPDVDFMRAQKDKELEEFQKQCQDRKKHKVWE